MPVSMMDVRDVGMVVSDGRMTVRMRMRLDHRAVVRMMMMFIVNVRMVMLDSRMSMKVAVPFSHKQ